MWYPNIKLTRRIRLGIMILLILSFFIISPLILLYTAGYRFDIKTWSVHETGVIAIDVEPNDAQVFLNGTPLSTSMPIRLSNRAPGSYTLKIEKGGYLLWENTIQVESKKTTYVTDLYLFLDVLPTYEYPSADVASLYSPDGRTIVTTFTRGDDNYSIHSYSVETTKEFIIFDGFSSSTPDLLWSTHAPLLAIVTTSGTDQFIQMVDVSNPERIDIYTITSSTESQIQWHEHGDQTLYTKENGSIISLKNGKKNVLAPVTSTHWFVDSNEDVWSISNTQSLEKNGEVLLQEIPNTSIVDILDTRADHIVVRDEQNNIRVVWLNSGETTRISGSHIFPKTYGKNWSTWIVWSEWEVFELLENGEVVLLTRTNEPITNVVASTKYNSLLLGFEQSIAAFHPYYKTNHTLFSSDTKIHALSMDESNKYILFDTAIHDKRGTYKRAL